MEPQTGHSMLALILIVSLALLAINLSMWSMSPGGDAPENEEEGNGTGYVIGQITQYCVSVLYIVYARCSLVNMTIFVVKYVPTGLYMYKFVKDMYLTSRERIKQKQSEMEDIQLQIQIVKSKLCVCDAKFAERTEQLRKGADRLRNVRARLRDVIMNDDVMRQVLNSAAQSDINQDIHLSATSKEEDCDFLVELFAGLKYDNTPKAEWTPEKMDCGEHAQTEPSTPENSVYSSLSDADIRQDCRVKIVKITNVYKVAYLKHCIKQKRLRRAIKHALLKKKIESIKNLLEDWQKTLNMVINSKLTLLNIDHHPIDVVSQEAMGDYSKPRGSTDSDSDIRNSWSDVCYDEYSINWTQNSYRPYVQNYEEVPETSDSKDGHDFQDYGDGSYTTQPMSECNKMPNMMSIEEETNSQLAIEESKSEPDEGF